jgi:hypothetical protein
LRTAPRNPDSPALCSCLACSVLGQYEGLLGRELQEFEVEMVLMLSEIHGLFSYFLVIFNNESFSFHFPNN